MSFDVEGGQIREVVAEEGRPFSIDCPDVEGYPTPHVTWFVSYENSEEDRVQMSMFTSNRTAVGANGTAYFAFILPEDDSYKYNKTYMCLGVHAAAPQDYSHGQSVKIKVVPPEDGILNGPDPHLNIESFLADGTPNVTTLQGAQDNKLRCIFAGE